MKCRSCDAPMVFRRTADGKAMPLDPKPDTRGNVVLEPGGFCRVLAGDELAARRTAGKSLFMPHHATCPDGEKWRKP